MGESTGGSIRDRLSALSHRELLGLVALVLLVVGGAALWYARSLPRGVQIETAGAVSGPSAAPGSAAPHSGAAPTGGPAGVSGAPPTAAPTAIPAPTTMFVHVAGEVARPGVYGLPAGARVVDALEAAGGPTARAVLDALNLAAPLADGQQVLVPRRGQVISLSPPGTAPGTTTPAPSATAATGGALVNINTASASELETLPGIGEVLAQTIVDHRTEHGPFASVDALEDVSGIGPSTLEEIRDLVTV